MRKGLILPIAIALPVSALGAAPPSALAQVAGGLWEITGVPGSQSALRQCVPNVITLAQFEHRGKNCSRSVISDKPGSLLIRYTCGQAGFGRTQMDVVTPRALRISTQGISDELPFNYVLEARRVGDCEKSPSSPHH